MPIFFAKKNGTKTAQNITATHNSKERGHTKLAKMLKKHTQTKTVVWRDCGH